MLSRLILKDLEQKSFRDQGLLISVAFETSVFLFWMIFMAMWVHQLAYKGCFWRDLELLRGRDGGARLTRARQSEARFTCEIPVFSQLHAFSLDLERFGAKKPLRRRIFDIHSL